MGEKALSTDEAELYDRQIRLWGIESQEKLRAANILLVNIRGLGSEIAKNIVLSGVNSLTILDDAVVTEEEVLKNFLLSSDAIGKNIAEAVVPKAQALNPLVKITSEVEPLAKKQPKYFADFTLVIVTELNTQQMLDIAKACREQKVKFICGDNFGMFGFTIADFQKHEYFEDKVQFVKPAQKRTHDGKLVTEKPEKTVIKVAASLNYPEIEKVVNYEGNQQQKRRNVYYYLMLTLLEFRNKKARNPSIASKEDDLTALKEIKQKILKEFKVNEEKLPDSVLDLIFGEIVPVCSIIGGVLSQEVIKAVSGREVPIRNVFLFDPLTYSGREEVVGC